MQIVTQFAAEAVHESGDQTLVEAFGLDLRVLIIQIVAFLIVFLVLRRFVFPPLLKMIDDRQEKIDASVEAADRARNAAEQASKTTELELTKAKAEAAEIVEIARKEASGIVSLAESTAQQKADHLVKSAESRLQQDVQAAREQLRSDMVQLVADAASILVEQKIDPKTDRSLIEKALTSATKEKNS